jgi:hypothetical protein
MGGARYYRFKKGSATFFALDSNYMDSSQLSWLQTQLQSTNTPWKISFFHHPLYSDGRFHAGISTFARFSSSYSKRTE